MARIADDEIKKLKQEISLQRVVESAGIALKRHGADLLGLCPFHDDKTPFLGDYSKNQPLALSGSLSSWWFCD